MAPKQTAIGNSTRPSDASSTPASRGASTSTIPTKPVTIPIHCRTLSRSPSSGAASSAVKSGWPAVIKAEMPIGSPAAIAHQTPPT